MFHPNLKATVDAKNPSNVEESLTVVPLKKLHGSIVPTFSDEKEDEVRSPETECAYFPV